MFNRNTKTAPFIHLIITFELLFVAIFQNIPVYAEVNTENGQEDVKPTVGVINGLLDFKDNFEDKGAMHEAGEILLNQLGLNRINDSRRKYGLPEFSSSNVCGFGDEIVNKTNNSEDSKKSYPSLSSKRSYTPLYSGKSYSTISSEKSDISFASQNEDSITFSYLPSSVDNSMLESFPPIGDQGRLNSCVSYSTTYYQMTHMFGMALGWNAKNDTENMRKFSPKWTFNLTNAGENGVFGLNSTYLLFSKCGAALWNEFPYNPDDESQKNYMEWPTDASVWRNALNYRIEDFGYVNIWDGSQTPVESPADPNLNKVKQLLNNGYVLTFETNVSMWRFSQINDDSSTNEDDAFVNENIAHMMDSSLIKVDGHVMTLVGYNDNIWVDINENGIVEQGEKGAFKIANSWGTSEEMVSSDNSFSWHSNEGFVWLSYDALNNVSSVPDCPVTKRRNAINGGNKAYWISPKTESTPKLLIEYTLNTANKYDLETLFGYSNYDKKSPVSYIDPYNINLLTSNPSIISSFDGTSNACDASFVFDISELYDKYDSLKGKLYLTLLDRTEGNPCTLKDIKIVDNVSGKTYNYDGKLPVSFDNTSLTVGPFSFKKSITSLKGYKLSSEDLVTRRNCPAVASLNNKVYVIGGINENSEYSNAVEVYDPETDTWKKKRDMIGDQADVPYAVSVDNRLFVIKKLSSGEGVIEEYNSAADTWDFKSEISYLEDMHVMQTDGKLYIVGSDNAYSNKDVVFGIDAYDIDKNTVSEETYMEKGLIPISTSALDGKIYIFGCRKYDPGADLKADDGAYKVDARLRVYDIKSKSWKVGEEISFNSSKGIVELNGKFYGLYSDTSQNSVNICEFDPVYNTSTNISGNFLNRKNFGIGYYKDSLMLIGGKETTSATELDRNSGALELINVKHETISPVLEQPEDLILEATEQITEVDIGMAEAIGNTAVTVTNDAPKSFPIGTTYVLWTAEDLNGNITKAVQEVTMIIDKDLPDLVIPSDIFIGTNQDEKYVDVGKADVRNKVEVTIINNSPHIFPLGKTIVEWSAADNFGHMTSKTQLVNVYKYGDLDGNGEVNTIDFGYMRMLLLGSISELPGELGKYAADVDGSSEVTSVDFAILRQYLLGSIKRLPAGE